MGIWGLGFLENDNAGDAEAAYERHRAAGLSVAGAVQAVYKEYHELLQDPDARPDVVLTLAWLTAARGKVPAKVAKDALEILASGGGLKRWEGTAEYGARRDIERQLAGIIQGSIPHPERKNRPTKPAKPVVGDVFAVPLTDCRHYAYAHYVFEDPRYGPMVQIYTLRTASTPPMQEIVASGPLFRPVYVSLRATTETWGWRKVGEVQVADFVFPVFASRAREGWWIYDGSQQKWVEQLPAGILEPEPVRVWSHDGLVRRIETGRHPYSQ